MYELIYYATPLVMLFTAWTWLGFLCVTVGLLMDKGYNGILGFLLYLILPLPMIVYAVGAPVKQRKSTEPDAANVELYRRAAEGRRIRESQGLA
jgi:hypothetical protein